MAFALAGIVGLATYLQAASGGWKLPAVSVGLAFGGLVLAFVLQDQITENGQIRVLVSWMSIAGVLMMVGCMFGLARHRVSAGKLAWIAGGLTFGGMWLWGWIGILT